jgi:diguanylate cyclase (GGDEF)-like protein/PAS domain S-box-containing protein
LLSLKDNRAACGVPSYLFSWNPPVLQETDMPHNLLPAMRDATDAYVEIDVDDVIRDWSSHAERMLGWSAADAVGRTLGALLFGPTEAQAWRKGLQRCLAREGVRAVKRRIELSARHKQGHAMPVELTVTLVTLSRRTHFTVLIRDISSQRAAAEMLRDRTALLNLCAEAVVIFDTDDNVLFWSAGAERTYGWLAEEAIRRNRAEVLPEIPVDSAEAIRDVLLAKGSWEGETLHARRDGTVLQVLCRWAVQQDRRGDPRRFLMASTDITHLRHTVDTSAQLRESEQRFHALFEHHVDGVFAFRSPTRLSAANQALSDLTGYQHDELLAMPLERLVAQPHQADVRSRLLEALHGKPQAMDMVCIRKDGGQFDANVAMLPNMIAGSVVGVHGIVKDVSHRRQSERRIEYLANHDALTGLPNRNLLEERTRHAIEQARRLGTRIGALFMDLNRFKVINDSLGHDVGDLLLCAVAERLKNAVREGDTVARLGGDEFVVLLENIQEYEQIARVADNLLKVVSMPIELAGHTVSVSTSIGASIYPNDGEDSVTLFKNADLAMYDAKASGSGLFRLYDGRMNARAVERLQRENSLRRALDSGEFVVYYQPRLDMATNTIASVEALVRWNHPLKGLIFPGSFIPLAEEIGVIDVLGEWVLATACRQLKAWQAEKLPPLRVSVNLSALQLGSDGIRDIIADVLNETRLDGHFLELEITESSLMQDIDACARKLNDIRSLGVTLSIDDFGTGYSSLGYLKRLPIDILKIDKSFVGDISTDEDDAAIVSATIAMAHRMNLRVVAEGVTSHDQLRFLESFRCDEIQGYLLCQPLPADEMTMFFRTAELRGITETVSH